MSGYLDGRPMRTYQELLAERFPSLDVLERERPTGERERAARRDADADERRFAALMKAQADVAEERRLKDRAASRASRSAARLAAAQRYWRARADFATECDRLIAAGAHAGNVRVALGGPPPPLMHGSAVRALHTADRYDHARRLARELREAAGDAGMEGMPPSAYLVGRQAGRGAARAA